LVITPHIICYLLPGQFRPPIARDVKFVDGARPDAVVIEWQAFVAGIQ
jgi:hypothetical protein